MSEYTTCPSCHGQGLAQGLDCMACNGSGLVSLPRTDQELKARILHHAEIQLRRAIEDLADADEVAQTYLPGEATDAQHGQITEVTGQIEKIIGAVRSMAGGAGDRP
jgi:DnaJ-class molecular chaperone